MARRTENDLAITALAVEAECRRKRKGMIRYNYGDLVADTTPEERQRIIEDYKTGGRHRNPDASGRFIEANDKIDLQAVQDKLGIQAGKPSFHPPKKKFAPIKGKK